MAYDREQALRLVLEAVRPHLEPVRNPEAPVKSIDDDITEIMAAMEEEPPFGHAFDAAVKAVWDAAQYFALNP